MPDPDIRALGAAADRLRGWFRRRLDDQALDVARLYRTSRDRFTDRLRLVYEQFLSEEPSLQQARLGPAGPAMDAAVAQTVDQLSRELGQMAVDRLLDLHDAQPRQLNRILGTRAGMQWAEVPASTQKVLGELTTRVVGGGTFMDRLTHQSEELRSDLYGTLKQSLLNGDDFKTVRDRVHKAFGVDSLEEPDGPAYGSVKHYENEARRQWNALMGEKADETDALSVWWATLDERTTPGCVARHGRTLAEIGESPPRHWNCRCVILPVPPGTDRGEARSEADDWLSAHGYTRRQAAREAMRVVTAEFDPAQHPRDPGGKFAAGGGADVGPTLTRLVRRSRGVARAAMPQFSGAPAPGSRADRLLPKNEHGRVDATGRFLDHLRAKGVGVTQATVNPSSLRATQGRLDQPEIEQMLDRLRQGTLAPGRGPILVSRDNYVLDGHHRWAAHVLDGRPLPVRRIGLPMRKLLRVARQFSRAWGIRAKEAWREAHAPLVTAEFDPGQHPRASAGSPEGGQFTSGGGATARPPSRAERRFLGRVDRMKSVLVARRDIETSPQTTDTFKRPDGTYAPERQRLHDDIVREMLNPNAAPPAGTRPTASLLLGPPASGKSTILRERVGLLDRSTVIDADAVKARLPEYNGRNAASVHAESGDVAEGQLLGAAIRAGHNVVLDSTGRSAQKLTDIVEKLSRLGYDVDLYHATLPPLKAAQRALVRFKSMGRFVDPKYIIDSVGVRPDLTYQMLKRSGLIRKWESYDNDVPFGAPPKLRDRGSQAGPGRVSGGPASEDARRDPGRARPREAGWAWGPDRLSPLYQVTAALSPGRYSSLSWRDLPALVVGAAAPPAPVATVAEAQRQGAPDHVLLDAAGRGWRVLTEAGWRAIAGRLRESEGSPGRWIETSRGYALDSPDAPAWDDEARRFPLDLVNAFPEMRRVTFPALRPGEWYAARIMAPEAAEAATLGEGLDASAWTLGQDLGGAVRGALYNRPDESAPTLVLAVLAEPTWDVDADQVRSVVALQTGEVIYAADPFSGDLVAPYRRAAAAVLEPDGSVWAIRPRGRMHWTLPGGHLDPGETAAMAAERETREEAGVKARATRFLGRLYRPWSTTEVFLAERVGDPGLPTTGDEIDAALAVPLEWLEPADRVFLTKHLGIYAGISRDISAPAVS